MQWRTLFQKEMLELWRNRKWIWFPLVIMLLSVMDMLSYYFLPELIKLSGGVPEGTVFEIPELQVEDTFPLSIDTLNTYGMIIIAFVTMGTIVSEQKSGITEMILVKPVQYRNYITAKWAAYSLLIITALFSGLFFAWYYTNLLFGDMSFGLFLKIFLFYALWFIFIATLSLFFNTVFRSGTAVAGMTILTIAMMGMINIILGDKLTWFPNQLSVYVKEMIGSGEIPGALWGTAVIVILLIGLLLSSSIYIFKKKELIR